MLWRSCLLLMCCWHISWATSTNPSRRETESQDSFGSEAQDPVDPVVSAVPGVRPGSLRYHIGDGFFFHRQRASFGRVFLRCVLYRSDPSCSVRAVMNQDMSGFLVTSGEHNHAPDELHQQVQDLRNNLLQACRVRPNVRVDLIYHDVCRNVPRDVSSRISLLSIRPSMIRTQSENRPNIPYSFEDFDVELRNNQDLRTTLDGETDLYQGMAGAVGHRSLLFLSRRVATGAGNIRYIFGDATFYARPNQPDSAQLYTLVTVRDNHILPLASALMESRSQMAYRDLLMFIRRILPDLDPDFCMTDFEIAQQNAILDVFPRARLSGCLWHYSRAVCRNVRSLGLHAIVRDNQNARRIVRLCLAIPLSPPGRLFEALNAVVMEARRLNLQEQFTDLFNYLRATWIEGIGERTLCVFGVRHRTNNVAEAHHRNINSRVVRRPNVWRFIEMVREIEDVAWRDLGRLETGLAPSRARRVSSLLSDARIRSCSRQVHNREMDILHFLASVSWHLDNTMLEMLRGRADDEEGRPPSPLRGPPRAVSDDVRFSQENGLDTQSNDNHTNFEVEEVISHDTSNQYNNLDASDMFEDLMEDSRDEIGRRTSRRGRRGRGHRASRGSGRQRGESSTDPGRSIRGRTRTSRSLPALPTQSSNASQAHPSLPPPLVVRPEQFSDSEDLDDNCSQERRRWTEIQ
ncbi:putative WRKY transcription factor protein 1 [Frankliniella fusca]|uniref:WRKY transcription factor protein 1 n=1 Tax=Frankliniella fusca TaxID=407009 RepID=A0AAE1I391_9NEOP|nr:putative WRKY transcription factor protein 1 [Frankliniella fusca]